MVPGERFSFGPFEFEPLTGRLTRHGHKIKLQPKAAAALTCLVQQEGKVVSRGQLQEKLWPEGTYVNFDLGIKVAVKKLRDALGDASEEPVYIQTVHGEGYRFIAPVAVSRVPDSHEDPSVGALAEDVATAQFMAGTPVSRGRRLLWWGAAIGVTASVLLAFIPRMTRTVPVKFQNRDWVIFAAFENRTGEKLLDGTMNYALERALSQSSYVNIAPPDRINDSLKLMRQSPGAVLTEDLARQVAIRDGGIKAVVSGRVEKFDRNYVLTVRLVNPTDVSTAVVWERQANKDQLPNAARMVSDDLRRKLGEKMPDTGAFHSLVLEKATTPSLAALRAFSAGMEQVNKRNWGQALVMLEGAILEDPNFAFAHIYAAHCYSNLNQEDKAAPHYQAAFRLAPGVTERERLFILGSYHSRFLHDDQRAIDAYQALVNLYPDDYWGLTNLAQAQLRQGQLEQRTGTLERLAILRPNSNDYFALFSLWIHYKFDHPDKNKARIYRDGLRRLRSTGPPPVIGWSLLDALLDMEAAMDGWMSGDLTAAAKEIARVNTHAMTHGNSQYKMFIAVANLTLGKLSAARELCASMEDLSIRRECFLRAAYAAGNRKLGEEQLSQLRRSNPSSFGSITTDIVLATWLGDVSTAKRWASPLLGRESYRLVAPMLSGWILLSQRRWPEVVKKLEDLRLPPKNWAPWWNRYPLAIALERQGRLQESIAALQVPDEYPITLWDCWTWPQSHAKLAELYRKAGRVDDAVKVEDRLRLYLSQADADHPLLAQLRAAGGGTRMVQNAK